MLAWRNTSVECAPVSSGGLLGPASSGGLFSGALAMDRTVPPGGYAWWYLDALSDDGRDALTLIAFVGSVFSPYYAWSGRADPLNHVAFNVALYRRGANRWTLTERGRHDLVRGPAALQVGQSALWLDGHVVRAHIQERGWPIPHRVRGSVTLTPEITTRHGYVLSAHGDHHWWPLAPRARVQVAFDEPRVRFEGTGYLDCNWGAQPLEDAFQAWTWCRAPLARGAAVLYDVTPAVGEPSSMALRFAGDGTAQQLQAPPRARLPHSMFGLARETRSESPANLVKTLTSSHFYVRSQITLGLFGETVTGIHETLALDRFAQPWAKLLLPFRMPRNPGRAPVPPPAPKSLDNSKL